MYSRMIRNLIPPHEPVGNKCVVSVRKRGKVGHLDRTPVRVLALCEELIHSVQCVRLDSIVRSEENELWDLRLTNGMNKRRVRYLFTHWVKPTRWACARAVAIGEVTLCIIAIIPSSAGTRRCPSYPAILGDNMTQKPCQRQQH